MEYAVQIKPHVVSAKALWTGRIMSAVATLFLLIDSMGKILKVPPVVEGTLSLGYPETVIAAIGVVLLLCTILFAVPRSSVLGAILLTGYLGGAVATHVRVGSPLLTHILFPIYVSVLIWGGLCLRQQNLRALMLTRE